MEIQVKVPVTYNNIIEIELEDVGMSPQKWSLILYETMSSVGGQRNYLMNTKRKQKKKSKSVQERKRVLPTLSRRP